MSTARIAISLNSELLKALDDLVAAEQFPSRSGAVQKAIYQYLERTNGTRLARECAKLDQADEIMAAEEGMQYEMESWPEY